MDVEVRTIDGAEAVAYRRAIRFGFAQRDTVDDETWAAGAAAPFDRAFVAVDGGRFVATLQSFPTALTMPGGAFVDVGALTAVTCQATHRRRGVLTKMITADLAASKERGEVADILIAAEYLIYGRFGYGPAVMSTGWDVDVRSARFTTPGAGTVEFVDDDAFRKEAPAIFEQVRARRPGMIARSDFAWDVRADLRRRPEDKPYPGFRVLCRGDDGTATGWANYKVEDKWEGMRPFAAVEVSDLCAATPQAEARLWRFVTELDWVATVAAADRPVDDVLPWLLADGRAAKSRGVGDFVWVRPLDVPALLAARTYPATGRIVLDVVDDQGLVSGRYALDVGPDGASCSATTASADVTLPARTLGAVVLGGPHVGTLHAAGWLDEHSTGAVARADALFAGDLAPWCNTWF